METLSPACAKAQLGSSNLSALIALITLYIFKGKMRGKRLSLR
jgi:hypothetical protein